MGEIMPPATSLWSSSHRSKPSLGSRGHTLLVRLSILFISHCCSPKIACSCTRPCPPSGETRVNGRQSQSNAGNRYSTSLLSLQPGQATPTLTPDACVCSRPSPAVRTPAAVHQGPRSRLPGWAVGRRQRGARGADTSQMSPTQVTSDL